MRVCVCSWKERGKWYLRPNIKPTHQDSVLVPNVLKMSKRAGKMYNYRAGYLLGSVPEHKI